MQEERTEAREMVEEGRPAEEPLIPKHRLDEESRKRKALARELAQLREELGALRAERERVEEERDRRRGEYEKIAEKERKKRLELEKELGALRAEMERQRKMSLWREASRDIIRPDAVDDAFLMLPEEELAQADSAEELSSLARRLAEKKAYLAARPSGVGSRGAARPALSAEEDARRIDWNAIKRKKRRGAFA